MGVGRRGYRGAEGREFERVVWEGKGYSAHLHHLNPTEERL